MGCGESLSKSQIRNESRKRRRYARHEVPSAAIEKKLEGKLGGAAAAGRFPNHRIESKPKVLSKILESMKKSFTMKPETQIAAMTSEPNLGLAASRKKILLFRLTDSAKKKFTKQRHLHT